MRLLIIAEGATLAHVGRPLLVAEEAFRQGWEVIFARPKKYAWMTLGAAFEVVDLDVQSSEEFARRLAQGKPLYDFATLDLYVAADRRLIRDHWPDAIVGDFRLSLAVSARLENCPYVTLSNAYWSPFLVMQGAMPVPDLPMTRFMPIPLAEALFNLVRPLAFLLHAQPMRRLRKKYGLNHEIGLREAYTDADVVCYCDLPGMFELSNEPATHLFVGPLVWSPDVAVPPSWARLQRNVPTIYFTLGSSGRAELVAPALNCLAQSGYQILFSSAGHSIDAIALPNVFQSAMLPGNDACTRSDLVICNGGSPTTQQALCAGKPVVALPSNLDQYLNMSALVAHGLGDVVRSDRYSDAALLAAAKRMLSAGKSLNAVESMRTAWEHGTRATVSRIIEAIQRLVR